MICLIIMAGLVVFALGISRDHDDGLSNSTGSASFGDQAEDKKDIEDQTKKETVEDDISLNGKDVSHKIDLSSEDVILEFLSGEWTMINRDTREDFGVLRIGSRGTFNFVRTRDSASGYGSIGFSHLMAGEDEAPDQFELKFDDMKELIPEEALPQGDTISDETGGIFHVGIGEDKDYLYLKEIGNGDSMISYYAFNVNSNVNDRKNWTPEWLFVRDRSAGESSDKAAGETFYA